MHRQQQSPPVQESTPKMKFLASLPSPRLHSPSTSHFYFIFLIYSWLASARRLERRLWLLLGEKDSFSLNFLSLRGATEWILLSQTPQTQGSPEASLVSQGGYPLWDGIWEYGGDGYLDPSH